jgi:hypothetical protein
MDCYCIYCTNIGFTKSVYSNICGCTFQDLIALQIISISISQCDSGVTFKLNSTKIEHQDKNKRARTHSNLRLLKKYHTMKLKAKLILNTFGTARVLLFIWQFD